MSSAVNQQEVYDQLTSIGLIVDSFIIGRMVRCRVEGTREKKGWYSLHDFTKDNGDVIIVGSYGIWQGNDNGARKINIDRLNTHRIEKRLKPTANAKLCWLQNALRLPGLN